MQATLDKKKLYPRVQQFEQLSLIETDEEFQDFLARFARGKEGSEHEKEMLLSRFLARKGSKEIEPIVPIAYFPAFRTMIEAWVAAVAKRDDEIRRRYSTDSWKNVATERARNWFGEFTPKVNFPSLVDIETQLAAEIEHARASVWRTDQTLVSDAFLKIFASLSNNSEVDDKEETLLALVSANLKTPLHIVFLDIKILDMAYQNRQKHRK